MVKDNIMIKKLIHKYNKWKFDRLYRKWFWETAVLSNTDDIHKNINYQKIIKMGKVAIPLIIEKMKKEPDFFFEALRQITGEDPVPYEHRGHLMLMTQDWIDWYEEKYDNR